MKRILKYHYSHIIKSANSKEKPTVSTDKHHEMRFTIFQVSK